MSEILSKYSIPCPGCWNETEKNNATLEILKDWNDVKYVFQSATWVCTHCDGKGHLTPKAVSRLPGFQEIDLGIKNVRRIK